MKDRRHDVVVRYEAQADVLKVWLYAVASVWLGAWFSPYLYNAGKAIYEVSLGKTTNGLFEWLAEHCGRAGFSDFFLISMMLAATLLFFPWMEWMHSRRGTEVTYGPWAVRLPNGARTLRHGQHLGKNPLGLWQLSAGFLLVAGLLLPMSASLVAIGWFKMHLPEGLGLGPILLRTLPLALLTAWVVELFFRGVVMGVFLRAMRPAAALGMSAAFFAMIASVIPPEGLNVVDPESGSVGFEMLRLLGQRFADGSEILQSFVPFLALGLVLAYARWRTASLWLPIGMHAGWLTAKKILSGMIAVNPGALPADGVSLVQHMILPLVALAITGLLAHYMTENPKHPDAPRS